MPLWFVSCHSRRLKKIASRRSITPSPLPPFSGLSYSASARNPLRPTPEGGGGGCAVKLPNSSVPLSITPLPLRSSASQASSEFTDVHETRSLRPSPLRSNITPPAASVRLKPSPLMSTSTGIPFQQQPESLETLPYPGGQP